MPLVAGRVLVDELPQDVVRATLLSLAAPSRAAVSRFRRCCLRCAICCCGLTALLPPFCNSGNIRTTRAGSGSAEATG